MIKLNIKRTKRYGDGVFAAQDVKKGEVIRVFGGKRLDVNQVWAEILSGKISADYPLQIGRRTHLILDPISRFFNHSCDPNSGLRKNAELFAIRDISKGEEITFDYSLTCSPTDDWKMKCNCGSDICRKSIGDILTIPKNRLAYYQRVGALQTYMKRLLPRILKNRHAIQFYDRSAIRAWVQSNSSREL